MDPMGLWDLGTHLWSEKSHDCHCMVIFCRDFLPCYDLSYNQVMMKEASRLSICCFRDWREGWCYNFELILLMVRKSRVSPVEVGSLFLYLPGKFTSQVVFLRDFWTIKIVLTSFLHCFPTWDRTTNPNDGTKADDTWLCAWQYGHVGLAILMFAEKQSAVYVMNRKPIQNDAISSAHRSENYVC